jgi:hypothetical protein
VITGYERQKLQFSLQVRGIAAWPINDLFFNRVELGEQGRVLSIGPFHFDFVWSQSPASAAKG